MICVVFNKHEKVHQIVIGQNDASAPTGFFHLANSMIVHNNYVYIQGDVRVRGFNLDNLECIDTLHIPKDIIKKSAIAIWNENIAVSVDDEIYLYTLQTRDKTSKEDSNFKKKHEEFSIKMGNGSILINWTHGRKRKTMIKENKIKKITSMISVGEKLIVASDDYPVIHVYGSDESLIACLIDHTMGITALHSIKLNIR